MPLAETPLADISFSLEQAKQWLNDAEAVLLGAGAGKVEGPCSGAGYGY